MAPNLQQTRHARRIYIGGLDHVSEAVRGGSCVRLRL